MGGILETAVADSGPRKVKWFILYAAMNTCMSNLQVGCGGSYTARMAVPSQEICEQIVRDNPHQTLECVAKAVAPEPAK